MTKLFKTLYQCEKSSTFLTIANALLWAAVILATSWVLRGTEQAETMFFITMTAATTSFLMIENYRNGRKQHKFD